MWSLCWAVIYSRLIGLKQVHRRAFDLVVVNDCKEKWEFHLGDHLKWFLSACGGLKGSGLTLKLGANLLKQFPLEVSFTASTTTQPLFYFIAEYVYGIHVA